MGREGKDQRIFDTLIRLLEKKKPLAGFPDQLILDIGKCFLGKPYVTGMLETRGGEHLVVNLREFDCVTFVETVIALVFLVKSGKRSFRAFRNILQKIRYRHGRPQGYASRLHYFSDWIHDNQKKGMIRDLTAEIGGRRIRKVVNFMTTNPELYLPLRNAANLRRMKSVEKAISKRFLSFIPKKALGRLEGRIRDGDLIAVTTDVEGLDIQHVGFAVKVRNRVHLLHASGLEGKVVFSQKTLYRHLMQSKARTGVVVGRIL